MLNAYTRQLRADSTILLTYALTILTFAVSLGGVVWFIGRNNLISLILLIVIPFISGYTGRISRQLAADEQQYESGVLLVGSHLLIVTILFGLLWTPHTLLPYAYLVVIVASNMAISPRAGFTVWILSLILMMGTLFAIDRFVPLESGRALTNETLLHIGVIALINLIVNSIDYLSSLDWQFALESVSALQHKTQQRRDELFNTKQQLEQSNRRLQVLNTQLETSMAVNHHVTSILDIDELLTEVVQLLRVQFRKYSYVSVFLLDDAKKYLILHAQSGITLPQTEKPLIPLNQNNTLSQASVQKKAVQIDDMLQTTYDTHPFWLTISRSEVSVPLIVGGELFGVLNIQSQNTYVFDPDELKVLRGLADQVAIAIQNAILYRKEGERRHLVEKLYDIGRALSGTLNLDEELNLILEYLTEIVPHERTAVLLHRDNQLDIIAARGFPPDFDPQKISIPIDDEEELYTKIFHTLTPLAVTDVVQLPSWKRSDRLAQPRAWLGIPLIHDDNVIGILSLARSKVDPFEPDEVTLANTFASQAAIALQNARLFNRVEQFNQELEVEVKKRTEDLQIAYDKLERLDRTKSDFIGVASHELRTPLTVVRGYSTMLLQDKTIAENPMHSQLAAGIESGVQRMHQIVDKMLELLKIDNRALKIVQSQVSIAPLIAMLVHHFSSDLEDRQLTVIVRNLSNLPDIMADSELIQKVFYHLLVNAIKYTPDGGEITVVGRYLSSDNSHVDVDSIEVVVADSGIGIDPEFHELVFDKFYQTGEVALHSSGQTKFKGGGPGLGLAIARGIVEAHNGTIWVESAGHDEENFTGSQFFVVLPVEQPKFPSES